MIKTDLLHNCFGVGASPYGFVPARIASTMIVITRVTTIIIANIHLKFIITEQKGDDDKTTTNSVGETFLMSSLELQKGT